MPRGGKRTGAGRPKGAPNKVTRDIKVLAQERGPDAIKKLVDLLNSDDERVQIAAIKELLDRGYGKSAQPLTGEGGEGPIEVEDVSLLTDAERI